MVLGVLQTSRGIRFASLDVRPKKAVDIVRNSGAATKTAVSSKVLFMRPLSDKAVDADSTVGKRMIAAYTANHTGKKLVLDRPTRGSVITRLRSNTSKAVLALGAVASAVVLGTKRFLPHKVYSISEGRHFTWPAMKLNRAQFSNMVATGIVAFGLASFALWAPAYKPSPPGGDQPISAFGSDDGSQRSRETSSPSGQDTDSAALGQDGSDAAPPAALEQTPASQTQLGTAVTLPRSTGTLPVGGSGGGVSLPAPLPSVSTPAPAPTPTPIPTPVTPVPAPTPTAPVITDVVDPVVNTVDNTVNNTTDTAGGLLGL